MVKILNPRDWEYHGQKPLMWYNIHIIMHPEAKKNVFIPVKHEKNSSMGKWLCIEPEGNISVLNYTWDSQDDGHWAVANNFTSEQKEILKNLYIQPSEDMVKQFIENLIEKGKENVKKDIK